MPSSKNKKKGNKNVESGKSNSNFAKSIFLFNLHFRQIRFYWMRQQQFLFDFNLIRQFRIFVLYLVVYLHYKIARIKFNFISRHTAVDPQYQVMTFHLLRHPNYSLKNHSTRKRQSSKRSLKAYKIKLKK